MTAARLLMTTITIPANVAEVLRKAAAATRLVDEQGKVLGSFAPATAGGCADDLTVEEIAEMKKRVTSSGPWYSTDDMIAYVQSQDPAEA